MKKRLVRPAARTSSQATWRRGDPRAAAGADAGSPPAESSVRLRKEGLLAEPGATAELQVLITAGPPNPARAPAPGPHFLPIRTAAPSFSERRPACAGETVAAHEPPSGRVCARGTPAQPRAATPAVRKGRATDPGHPRDRVGGSATSCAFCEGVKTLDRGGRAPPTRPQRDEHRVYVI